MGTIFGDYTGTTIGIHSPIPYCRNLIKKPWVFMDFLHESYDFGVIGPGFLNQVPTLFNDDTLQPISLEKIRNYSAESKALSPKPYKP